LVRLGYLATIQSGVTVDGGRDAGADAVTLPYLRVANVQDGHVDLESITEITVPRPVARSSTLRRGDVLMTEGGDLDKLGRGTVWQDEIKNCLHQNHVFAVRPDQRRLLPEYLALLTRTSYARAYFESTGTKTTNLASTSSSKIRDFRVPLPDIAEQRRIADFLDAETARIDAIVSAEQQARAVLIERRAAKVFQAVSGGVVADRVPSNIPWVDSLPRAWQGVRLGLFARMGSGHTPSRSHPEWWEDCTIPWITTGEVSQVRDDRREVLTETRERISVIGMANSAAELHPKGTVVLCRTASAGYSAVMGEDMATSQDFVTWTCGPLLDPFYLLWCLRAMRSDLLGRLAMGSTHKTIYVPDLQMLRIPLPPIEDQRGIVASIRASNAGIDVAIDAIDRQLVLLAERRQALITAAVTGQIGVLLCGSTRSERLRMRLRT
jgi:type I restriction enzyme S subunit